MVASVVTTAQPNCAAANSTLNSDGGVYANNNNIYLPKGKYTLVGIDIDTTGRRLIDEIVQLAAYTPKEHFEQYIMPYMNLNPAARQRHQVRVISIGFYRMLKSMQTYKIIKSKSEIAAIKDFLNWLDAVKNKDDGSLGIILLYHEERKFIPYMILESLKKYNLLDRFFQSVKSFTNGLNLVKRSGNDSYQRYSLRKLAKVLKTNTVMNTSEYNNNVSSTNGMNNMNERNNRMGGSGRDLFDGNASVRAKLAYEVALHLSNIGMQEAPDSPNAYDKLLNDLQAFARPVECDLNELQTQNQILERQNSFRPVFLNYFKTTIYHRVRAVKFRIILAEHGYDLSTLNNIWQEKKRDGLVGAMQSIDTLKADDKNELVDLLDSYFDPNKTTLKPIIKNNNRRRNRRGPIRNNGRSDGNNNRNGNEFGAGGDKQGSHTTNIPDSTTTNNTNNTMAAMNNKPPQQQRNKRNPRSRNYFKSQPPMATQTPAAVGMQMNNATAAPMAVAASN